MDNKKGMKFDSKKPDLLYLFEEILDKYNIDDFYSKDTKIFEDVDYSDLDYTLLPQESIDETVRVLIYGLQKYARDNWKYVDNWKRRYLNACLRHLFLYFKGENLDRETKLHHLGHVSCCITFLLSKELEKNIK